MKTPLHKRFVKIHKLCIDGNNKQYRHKVNRLSKLLTFEYIYYLVEYAGYDHRSAINHISDVLTLDT